MSFVTGTASNVNDLVEQLRIFCLSEGWTSNRFITSGNGREICLSRGDQFINIRSFSGETALINGNSTANRTGIALNGSDGFSSGATWDRQPNYPLNITASSGINQCHAYVPILGTSGPFVSHYFISPNSDCIFIELEVTAGVWQRFGFGKLMLYNPAIVGGGRFFYGSGGDVNASISNWLSNQIDSAISLEEVPFRAADLTLGLGAGSYLRCNFDSFNNWALSGTSSSTLTGQSCSGGGVHDKILRDSSPNPINNIGLLLPNIVSINRSGLLQPVGVIPEMRFMDMTNYLPKDEFTIGPDTWFVVPWYQKGGRSFQRGIAYKKVI